MHQAQLGDRVRVQYFRISKHNAATGKHPDQKTREFIVGSSQVFPTLSLGVVGMAQGDRKLLTLPPMAYGSVRPKLVRKIPRERFPQQLVLRVGKILTLVNATSRRRRRVRVVEINADSVTVDGNHPLAGKVIALEVCLISLDSSPNANQSRKQFDMGGES